MNPKKNLYPLKASFQKKLMMIELGVEQAVNDSEITFSDKDKVFLFSVIKAHNCWAQFSRAVALSAFLKPKLSDGRFATLGCQFKNMDDYIYSCAAIFNKNLRGQPSKKLPTRAEPDWASMPKLQKILDSMGYSEINNIDSAASLFANDVEAFTSARNFYAHKNRDTLDKTLDKCRKRYSMPVQSGQHLTEVIANSAYGRPQPLLLDWLAKLRLASDFMA